MNFGVPDVQMLLCVSRKFKDTSSTVSVEKNSKKHFSIFRMFKSEIGQICGFCLKPEMSKVAIGEFQNFKNFLAP